MSVRSSSKDGFSLVELAIVLTILGLIAGFSVPLLTETVNSKKWQRGDRQMEEVITALASYVVRHHHLPCPADPSVQGSERGIALETCDRGPVKGGLVPYKTLGLPESITQDGFKRPFSYYVDPALTAKEFGSLQAFCKDSKEHLTILGDRDQVLSRNSKNPVAFALVGHGETGEGAFTNEGGRRPFSSLSASERTNSEDSALIYDLPYSKNTEHPFRQQIKWVTRDHLLSYYAKCPCPVDQESPIRPNVLQPILPPNNLQDDRFG